MNPPRILFVDDEPRILQGFQNLFWRDKKKKWEMVFVASGEKALEELSKGPFTLVVSDMCMPGMDGVELMKQVSQRYPGTVRIILSGYSGNAVAMIPVAHQYLIKPCDPATLRMVIERAIALQERLDNPGLRNIIGKMRSLPSGTRVQQLSKILEDPDGRMEDIFDTIKQDPGLVIRVIQLANSTMFGAMGTVGSIDEAVRSLGSQFLKRLLLDGNILPSAENSTDGPEIDKLQPNWIASANLARCFIEDSKRAELAYTAALIRDIGNIIIAHEMANECNQIALKSRESNLPIQLIEKEVLGATHSEMGAYLMGLWGLPNPLVEAVEFHHFPSLKQQPPFDVVAAVHVAAAIVDGWDSHSEPAIDREFIERCGMQDDLPRWMATAEKLRNEAHQ